MEGKHSEPSLQLCLLGAPQVKQAEQALDIQRRKVQALLYYLAVSREWHQRATLAALLWPESDQQRAYSSLRRHLSELNRLLGDGWLETEGDAVQFTVKHGLWFDVAEFQRHLATCQQHDHSADAVCPRCIEPLTAAVALYRGDFLAGFTLPDAPDFDAWQLFQTEEMRFAYTAALDRLVEGHQTQNNLSEAISYARRRLNLDPLYEPTHRQLMRLYAASGQQAAALRQYQLCAQALEAELGLPPSEETTALYDRIRTGEFGRNEASPSSFLPRSLVPQPRHNLPATITPLIGRSTEVGDLLDLCRDPTRRLITLLGPGGIGKTSLSLAVAAHLVEGMSLDVFFVPLAQLSDPANMVTTIADALNFQFQADGRTSQEQLFAYLAQKQLYLILDNFEHLLEGVDFVHLLLQSCPELRLLVTSRERLKLTGETIFSLSHLDFPTWETPQQPQSYEAVQLFIETAERVRPNQALQADEMQYVARICRMVGGMPLGIILAAAWVEHLSPASIAAELTQGFDLLETELRDLPERQRSMQTILDYSWQRLTTREQTVFMRLALFRGGFTRAAAQAVAGATLPMLVRLADKSFIQPGVAERYDIHELLRQYARQQLVTAGAEVETQAAHARHYLQLLHDCEPRLAGAGQLEAIHQIEADFENIRAAWQWVVEMDDYALIDHALDGLFRWFWLRRSRHREGQALLSRAYHQWTPAAGQTPQSVWGRISARIMELESVFFIEPAIVRERVERALTIARQYNNQTEIAFCHWALGFVILSERHNALDQAAWQPAITLYHQAAIEYRQQGDQFWLAQILEHLGHCYYMNHQFDKAVSVLQESLSLRRTLGDRFGMARSFRELGFAAHHRGDGPDAEAALQANYALQCELGDQHGIADGRIFLAKLALCHGDWRRIREFARPVMALAQEINTALFQRWAIRALDVADCMEQDAQRHNSPTCSFPNVVNAISARLCFLLFSTTLEGRRENVQAYLMVATTDLEVAVCLPFAANIVAETGDQRRAVRLLALAFRYPEVAGGWIGHLPEIVALQQSLRDQLPPDEFNELWQQGQTLDLQATVTDLLNKDE